MKKFISIILILSLISLISCTDRVAEIYSENMISTAQESDTVFEEEESGTDTSNNVLVISSDLAPMEFSGVLPLVEGFKKLHPDVEIILNETGIDPFTVGPLESVIVYEKYMADLSVKILSGEAPDLLFSTGDSNSDFAFSGLLYDLNEFIENDETFIQEDFFMEVLNSWELEDALYSMPTAFTFGFARFRQDALDAVGISLEGVESVDYRFLFDTYYTVLDSGLFPEITHLGREEYVGKGILTFEERTRNFDKESMTVNFESEEFLDFLNTTNGYLVSDKPFGSFYIDGPDSLFERDDYLVEGSYATLSRVFSLTGKHAKATKAVPITTSEGELLLSGDNLSIPKDAKNAELAWEFIKYCIYESEKVSTSYDTIGEWEGDRFYDAIPLNKNNFQKICDAYTVGETQEAYMTEYYDFVIKALELPLATRIPSSTLGYALDAIQMDFYNGLMTAEECAKAMQDRAELYFAEIG